MKRLLFYVDDDSKICRYFREYAVYRGYACHCYHESDLGEPMQLVADTGDTSADGDDLVTADEAVEPGGDDAQG